MRCRHLLQAIAAVACLAGGAAAQAAIVYQLVGGVCSDSNAFEVSYPDPAGLRPPTLGAGPPVCHASAMSITLTFSDAYVPGTRFSVDWLSPDAARVIERMEFFDGYTRVNGNFLPGSGSRIDGIMPTSSGAGEFFFGFNPFGGGGIGVRLDGTWTYSNEGPSGPPCGIASTEGPGGCAGSSQYNSVGTYSAWQRVGAPAAVPEPSALALVALGLAAAGWAGRRKITAA